MANSCKESIFSLADWLVHADACLLLTILKKLIVVHQLGLVFDFEWLFHAISNNLNFVIESYNPNFTLIVALSHLIDLTSYSLLT